MQNWREVANNLTKWLMDFNQPNAPGKKSMEELIISEFIDKFNL